MSGCGDGAMVGSRGVVEAGRWSGAGSVRCADGEGWPLSVSCASEGSCESGVGVFLEAPWGAAG